MLKATFKYIGMNRTDEEGNVLPVNSYNEVQVVHGDTVEFEGFFVEKARKNPDYEEVEAPKKRTKKIEAPKDTEVPEQAE